jgi:hypothetical protein
MLNLFQFTYLSFHFFSPDEEMIITYPIGMK